MTENELRRLRRKQILQLLYQQTQESIRLQEQVDSLSSEVASKDASIERLKHKLDDKDESIERLKARLDDKDAQIEHLKRRLSDKDETIRSLRGEDNIATN